MLFYALEEVLLSRPAPPSALRAPAHSRMAFSFPTTAPMPPPSSKRRNSFSRGHTTQTRSAGSIVLLIAFFSLLSGSVRAQTSAPPLQLDPQLQPSQYMHRAWNTENGLPQNSVFSITQTQEGYVWLGTQKGLVRFDGVRFSGSPVLDSSNVQVGEVRALLEDRSGALWVGTLSSGALRIYQGRVTSFTTADGLPSDDVLAIYEDHTGTIWLGTDEGGLARYDGQGGLVTVDAQGRLAGHAVLSMTQDAEGRLWVGTSTGVMRLSDGQAPTLSPQEGLSGRLVRALYVDAGGTLWAGTDQGLATFREGQFEMQTTEDASCGHEVSALQGGPKGTLWVGTLDGGLCRLHEGQRTRFAARDGLSHNRVRALFQDREGSLWIGMEMGGLNKLSTSAFTSLSEQQGLSNNFVVSVLEGQDSTLWIGTDGGGLNRVKGGEVEHLTMDDGLTSNTVSALLEDRAGQLWVGTLGGGLCRLETEPRYQFTCMTTADGLPSDNVFSLAETSDGALWVGTDNELTRLQDGTITTYTGDDGLAQGQIPSLLEDRSGDLWIGAYGGGLSRFRNGRLISYAEKEHLPDTVLPLHEDADGTLWIGTNGGGLCRRQGERFFCFTTADGLHSNSVLQILEDEAGYLWLGSLTGISRVKKAALNAYAKGEQEAFSAEVYDKTDGLKSIELNGGTQPAGWKGQDGRLYFSTVEGVAILDPSRLAVNALPPPVHIEQVRTEGAALPLDSVLRVDGTLRLPSGQRDLEFRYTGLSFVAPERVQFQYKLEGYDQHWIDAGTRRSAYYTNLPPDDDYRFRVRAANSDGVWNEEGASLAFTVPSFFYETSWFFLLCALAVGATGTGAFRLHTRRMRERERELEQRVADQTVELRERKQALEQLNEGLEEEVQTQLTQKLRERERYEKELIDAKERAEESARFKSAILTNMSHEIRTPISGILGYAQILGEELEEPHREFADYIQQNGKRLMDTITSILDLSKIETDRFNIDYSRFDLRTAAREEAQLLKPLADSKGLALRTALSEQKVPVYLDRSVLSRILHNLVGNAIKFTEKGEVTIEADTEDAAVFLRVRDTGIGISDAFLPNLFTEFKQESGGLARSHEGSGLGLSITKRLVETMGGTISVESERGRGTIFTVEFARPGSDATPNPSRARHPSAASPSAASPESARPSLRNPLPGSP